MNPQKRAAALIGAIMSMSMIGGASFAMMERGANPGALLATVAMMAAAGAGFFLAGRKKKKADRARQELDPLGIELGALEKDLDTQSEDVRRAVDVQALLLSADRLRKQHQRLHELLRDQDINAVRAKLDAARARNSSEVSAIENHIRSLEQARTSLQATVARLSALQHEVTALRTTFATAKVDVTLIDDTRRRLAQLHDEITTADKDEEAAQRNRARLQRS